MRILCVTQRYYPAIGGAENLIKTYLDFLALEHDITVFTSNSLSIDSFWCETDSLIPDTKLDYPVKRFDILIPSKIKNDKNLHLLPLLSNYPGPFIPDLWIELLASELKYDLIIATAFPYDHVIPAFIAAKKWNIPIIAIPLIHDEFPELFMTAIRISMLSCADSIFVLSDNEKKLLNELGIKNTCIHKIKPFVKTSNLPYHDDSLLKKYNLKNKKIILFVGSKSFVKGIKTLIESMKKIWQIHNDVILLLVGPYTKEYQNYFRKLPDYFKKKIIDLEVIEEKSKDLVFESCDMFVLPSKSESFGLAIIEAWIHKKPVIGCNISSTKELIDNMENGILVSFDDIDGLSDAISKLLEDTTLAEKLGKMGYNKAAQFIDINNLHFFEELCLKTINQFKSSMPK